MTLPPPDIPFRTIGAALAGFAERQPRRTAIVSIDQNVSVDFATLLEEVERCAAHMITLGVEPGSRVAILSGECIEKLVLMLAAWRCGAVACPLHTGIAADHLFPLLYRLDLALVVWRAGLNGSAIRAAGSCSGLQFGRLGETPGLIDTGTEPWSLPDRGEEYGPGDEACILATSGTTDRPKCVIWDHLGLWLCGLSTIDFTGMTGEDRVLEYRTFSWLSPQILALMPFVALGLTVVMAGGFSRSRFFDWVRDYRITVAAGVPTVVNMLLDDPVDVAPGDLRSLRLMTASSAPLAPERGRRFEERYGIRLLQLYGASEGGWLCGNRHDRGRAATVGPPARYMDLAVVDADGEVCAAGREGEITIRGPQTAVATLTSDGRWEDRTPYRLTERTRVGDLGVMDADGFVTVTGRIKDVILRGGVSISPGEIDAAVMKHPGVSEAAAIGVPDPVWGEDIACYVVPAPGAEPDAAAILAHAGGLLPASRRPARIVFVDALPKNERGKIRRQELRELWAASAAPAGDG